MPDQHRIFANPPTPDHATASTVLEASLSDPTVVEEAADALVGLALYDNDRDFVEAHCVALGRRLPPGSPLLGLAGLCIGHPGAVLAVAVTAGGGGPITMTGRSG